jgi:hypothetical protein
MAGTDTANDATVTAIEVETKAQRETKGERAVRLMAEQAERQAEAERIAALADAAEAAASKSTPGALKHVDCRTFNHAWVPVEADRNPQIGWYMNMRCERCGTVRKDIVNRFGEVERRRYEYPDDYKDTDGWARSDWRMQYLRRLR